MDSGPVSVETTSVRDHRDWILVGLLVLVPALHASLAMIIRPSLFSDSGWGFLVLDSMKHGAPFNSLTQPNVADIATDSTQFMTWWSPGQYLVPGLFGLLGADLGLAMVLTSTLFSILGALGWYCFYREVGFPFKTVAIACLTIVTTRWFVLPFGIYNGGEVLLFGLAPWAALLFWRFRRLPAVAAPFLIGALLVLTCAKLTGSIFGCALLGACLFVERQPGALRRWSVATSVAIVFGLIFFITWVGNGPTPAGDLGNERLQRSLHLPPHAHAGQAAASLPSNSRFQPLGSLPLLL